MKDRGGRAYLQGLDFMGVERSPRFTHVLSPTRQLKKALHMSGRQYKKFRKLQRRLDKARSDVVQPSNVGEPQHGPQEGVQALPEQALSSAPGAATDSAGPEDGAAEAGGQRGAEAAQS